MYVTGFLFLRSFLKVCSFVLVTGTASSVAAEPLQLLAFELQPFVLAQGTSATGPAVDFVRHVMTAAGFEVDPKIVPLPRLLQSLDEGNTVAVVFGRTPEREAKYSWIGEVYADYLTFISPAGTKIDDLEAAKSANKIGVIQGGLPAVILKNKGFSNIEEDRSEVINANKLVAGRIDAWFVSAAMARYTLSAGSLNQTNVNFGGKIVEVRFWMTASKDLPAEVLGKLKAAFAAAQADGTHERFVTQIK